MNNQKSIMRISSLSIAANLLLSAFKLAAGLLAHSAAMVSDAVHSASDVMTTVMVMISCKLSSRAEDADHEYGHERLESIAALLMAAALALTGLSIGQSGIKSLMQQETIPAPGMLALIAAVVSIIVKEVMFRLTKRTAERTGSTALMADAWHHRSDAFSSIGALIGIAASRLGFPYGDPIASLIICVFILKTALDLFREAAQQLTDHACSPELETQMKEHILRCPGVMGIDLLHTRQFGQRIYADVEIAADGTLSLYEAHHIAETVHDAIEKSFPAVKHCMVHVNPASAR